MSDEYELINDTKLSKRRRCSTPPDNTDFENPEPIPLLQMDQFAIPPNDDVPDEQIQEMAHPPSPLRSPRHVLCANIAEAVLSTPAKKLTLAKIVQYFRKNFEAPKVDNEKLRRRIDRYLSWTDCFVKLKVNGSKHRNEWALSDGYIFLPDEKLVVRKERLEASSANNNVIFDHLGSPLDDASIIQIETNTLSDESTYYSTPNSSQNDTVPPNSLWDNNESNIQSYYYSTSTPSSNSNSNSNSNSSQDLNMEMQDHPTTHFQSQSDFETWEILPGYYEPTGTQIPYYQL